MNARPELLLFAGPNGSGKTTVINFLRRAGRQFPDYANADDIARTLPGTLEERNQQSQLIVRQRRDQAISSRSSFCYETVMSHSSHVEAMRAAQLRGFFVRLIFVTTDDPDINVARVENRVQEGGHAVPPDRIVTRYRRIFANTLIPAIAAADEALLFDTTFGGKEAEPQFVLHVKGWFVAVQNTNNLVWPTQIIERMRRDTRFNFRT